MLACDPARRPQSAAALAAEFAQLPTGPAEAGFPDREDGFGARVRSGRAVAGEGLMASAMRVTRGRRAKHEDDFFLGEIRRLAERLACTTDRLVDRAVLVTAGTSTPAEEQSTRLAALALAVRDLEPASKIAIATGRTTLLGQLPVGPLMERLPLLMDGQAPGTIRLDETTRRLLPPGFRVAGPPGALLLLGGEKAAQGTLAASAGEGSASTEPPPPVRPASRPRRPSAADG
jgi:hypothetical protein